jgi:hypothetical protein
MCVYMYSGVYLKAKQPPLKKNKEKNVKMVKYFEVQVLQIVTSTMYKGNHFCGKNSSAQVGNMV